MDGRDSSIASGRALASDELHAATLYFLEGKRRLLRARPGVTIPQQKDFLGMLAQVADKMVDASDRLEKAQPRRLLVMPKRETSPR